MNGLYRTVGFVALSAGLFCIGWIALMDCIVSTGLAGLDLLDWIVLDRIVLDGWVHIGFYALACYF